MSTKISQAVVKLTGLYGMVIMTLSKKGKTLNCYPLENDKDSVKNKIDRKNMSVSMMHIRKIEFYG